MRRNGLERKEKVHAWIDTKRKELGSGKMEQGNENLKPNQNFPIGYVKTISCILMKIYIYMKKKWKI